MSSPSDPQQAGRRDDETVVVPTGNLGRQPDGPYPPTAPYPPPGGGHPPAGGYPPPPPPYLDQYQQPAYNPYGQPYPDASAFPAAYPADVPPARRPGTHYLALLLLVLATLPFLGVAAAVLLGGATIQQMVPAEQLAQFEQLTGVNIVSLIVGFGVFVGVVALLYLLFSILAVVGRNWARILTTIMTVIFVLISGFWVLALTGAAGSNAGLTGSDYLAGLGVIGGPALLALIGTILLFVPAANRFHAARR